MVRDNMLRLFLASRMGIKAVPSVYRSAVHHAFGISGDSVSSQDSFEDIGVVEVVHGESIAGRDDSSIASSRASSTGRREAKIKQ